MEETLSSSEIMEAGPEWDAAFDDSQSQVPGDDWDEDFEEEDTTSDSSAPEESPRYSAPNPAERLDAEEEEQGSGADAPSAKEQSEADFATTDKTRTYTLKHLGKTREVGLDELITLGQKGLDYDRVKQELTQLRDGQATMESEHERFLTELAEQDGLDVSEFIDQVRARTLSLRENMDMGRALDRIRYERQLKALEDQASAAEKARGEARLQQGFADFRRFYPNMRAQDIPDSVWEQVKDGMSLLDAYTLHEADSLRRQVTQLQEAADKKNQTEQNASRSMGSKSTSGRDTHTDLWEKFLS